MPHFLARLAKFYFNSRPKVKLGAVVLEGFPTSRKVKPGKCMWYVSTEATGATGKGGKDVAATLVHTLTKLGQDFFHEGEVLLPWRVVVQADNCVYVCRRCPLPRCCPLK